MIAAMVVLVSAMARADSEPEWKRLFEQGVKLSAAGEWQAACELFQRSFELDPEPGGGVLGNLADCREKRGKPAAAWRLWIEAGDRWKSQGHDARASYARQRAETVARLATRVVVEVPDPQAPGLEVTVNGEPREAAAEIRDVVEPGEIEIAATLPGRPRFVRTERGTAGETVTVRVKFRARPEDPADPPPRPVTNRRRTRMRIAIGVGVGAVAGLGSGLALALVGNSRYDASAKAHCQFQDPPANCDATGRAEIADAQRLANLGTGFAVVGGALAVTSAILVITAPRDVRITPVASRTSAGLAIFTRF